MEFGIELPEFGITKGQNLNREARSAAQTSPARRAVGASLHPYNGFRRRLRILVHAAEVLVILVRKPAGVVVLLRCRGSQRVVLGDLCRDRSGLRPNAHFQPPRDGGDRRA